MKLASKFEGREPAGSAIKTGGHQVCGNNFHSVGFGDVGQPHLVIFDRLNNPRFFDCAAVVRVLHAQDVDSESA